MTTAPSKEQPFYKRLRWMREEAELTQKQAAKLMGVDYRTYCRWESGGIVSAGLAGETGAIMLLRKAKSEALSRQLIAMTEGKP